MFAGKILMPILKSNLRVANGRRLVLFLVMLTVAIASLVINPAPSWANHAYQWEKVQLPTQSNLLDLDFSDPQHGWLVGTDSALLETSNGGETWEPRNLELGEGVYRFVGVSFRGEEGWVVGKPALLLHTEDGGKKWNRIGLSSKLPGDPFLIQALGEHSAEMATDIGAIYRTDDDGRNWKALVQEAVGNTRNLYRSPDGRYIAVSAKGNFYSTWSPGDAAWKQHNRNSSRRVQNMGYTPDGRVWMLNRGGQLQFTKPDSLDEWEKTQSPRAAAGIGLLDLIFQDEQNVWITGGSSRLLHSEDGGLTWERDQSLKDVGANFYQIYFQNPQKGFILGQTGTLLKYVPEG